MNLFYGSNDLLVLTIMLVLILIVVLTIIIVCISRENRKKAAILSEIRESVSDINDKVGTNCPVAPVADGLSVAADTGGAKELQVVFVDNRIADDPESRSVVMKSEEMQTGIAVKFMDFNCATDKNGKAHTIEELREQIR